MGHRLLGTAPRGFPGRRAPLGALLHNSVVVQVPVAPSPRPTCKLVRQGCILLVSASRVQQSGSHAGGPPRPVTNQDGFESGPHGARVGTCVSPCTRPLLGGATGEDEAGKGPKAGVEHPFKTAEPPRGHSPSSVFSGSALRGRWPPRPTAGSR